MRALGTLIISDLGNRKPIDEYPPKIRDQVNRAYAVVAGKIGW
jgi:hypothetical protein